MTSPGKSLCVLVCESLMDVGQGGHSGSLPQLFLVPSLPPMVTFAVWITAMSWFGTDRVCVWQLHVRIAAACGQGVGFQTPLGMQEKPGHLPFSLGRKGASALPQRLDLLLPGQSWAITKAEAAVQAHLFCP